MPADRLQEAHLRVVAVADQAEDQAAAVVVVAVVAEAAALAWVAEWVAA